MSFDTTESFSSGAVNNVYHSFIEPFLDVNSVIWRLQGAAFSMLTENISVVLQVIMYMPMRTTCNNSILTSNAPPPPPPNHFFPPSTTHKLGITVSDCFSSRGLVTIGRVQQKPSRSFSRMRSHISRIIRLVAWTPARPTRPLIISCECQL